MAFIGRLILRLLVVPLGALAAILAGVIVAFVANWKEFNALVALGPPDDPGGLSALLVAGAWTLVFSASSAIMLMPGAVGILAAEVFRIRSWIFHALNGALSIWVGWWTSTPDFREQNTFYDKPTVLAVGLAAGFAYWAVAGWNAGLFRPALGAPEVPPAIPR
jgi:hypothetical protein